MLRRLRRHSTLLAWAAGILAVPALLGGVTAAPADPGPAPAPQPEPVEMLPPDPIDMQAHLTLTLLQHTADVVPAQFQHLVVEAASRHRIDPRLIAAVIEVETKWDPHAVGPFGELGLMQILPSTGEFLARNAGMEEYDLADPATNLHLAAGYLAGLIEEYGIIAKALAVYNGGPGAAQAWETSIYAHKVLRMYHRVPPADPISAQQAS